MANNNLKKVIQTILFIFCGLPGLFIFMTGAFSIFFHLQDSMRGHESFSVLTIMYLILLLISGGILVLIGIGKLKKWMYILVFISFPLLIFLFGYISYTLDLDEKGFGWIILAGILTFVIYKIIENYYKKRSDNS